jgi:hypothetical protein
VTFFIVFVVANSMVAGMVRLLRPVDIIKTAFRVWKAKSDSETAKAYERKKFNFARRYGSHMLVFLVTLTFRYCLAIY